MIFKQGIFNNPQPKTLPGLYPYFLRLPQRQHLQHKLTQQFYSINNKNVPFKYKTHAAKVLAAHYYI
jgi:hypothetical protein